MKTLKVGDPLEEDTFCGAVNSKVHYDKVMSYIKLAQEDPEATIHTGEGVSQLSLQGGQVIVVNCHKTLQCETFK